MEVSMVFGDPNRFAILIEYVSEWSDDSNYKNGLFHFCIDGKLFPNKARVATLSGDIFCLSDGNALTTPVENKTFFEMGKSDALSSMLKTMLPERVEPDKEIPDDFVTSYEYQASTYNLEDDYCYFFAVSMGSKIRIVGAQLSTLKEDSNAEHHWEDVLNPDIVEIYLDKHEVKKIIDSVINYYSTL
jgi:hypothetical protein